MKEKGKDFRFPRYIIYCGKFMTAKKIVKCRNGVACLYEDDELGVQTSFTANQFKYEEYYGNIERRFI